MRKNISKLNKGKVLLLLSICTYLTYQQAFRTLPLLTALAIVSSDWLVAIL